MTAIQTDLPRVNQRLFDRLATAHDASHYLLLPAGVVIARDARDVSAVMRQAREDGQAVTFRAGGTSLSGQASSAGLLVDTRRNFRRVEVLDGGARVRCEPGATIRSVNAYLAPFGRRLGPDPASEIACTVGGVVANNSSGMSCGTHANTYRTLDSLVLVLPSGTVVDTSLPDADARLRRDEPEIWEGLAALRQRVLANPASCRIIAAQYAMKNTMGYGLNSLVDFEEPVRILEHLVVGSEGTLGFVASATFTTVPVAPFAATALLVVDELGRATDALSALIEAGSTCLELLDAASLKVVQQYRQAPASLAALQVRRHAALLVEAQAGDEADLQRRVQAIDDVFASLKLSATPTMQRDPQERADLWYLRKGLYTTVAGARAPGTTNLLEDVAVPVDRLTATTDDLAVLFAKHGYDDAVIFGHARDGNIHFMITPDLAKPDQLSAYEAFTEDMVDSVLGHGGTLKAEHGTGRVMAPYVERQFGSELYGVMKAIKALVDPAGILNPGVMISDDPQAHLKHLKRMPEVDDFVDRCVECGYCEAVCPSRDLTTTPRRRIAVLRDAKRLPAWAARQVDADYSYEAVDTCAVDSLCLIACPVGIDTGVFMKTFRAARHPWLEQKGAARLAEIWGGAVGVLRVGLAVAHVVPAPLKLAATTAIRLVSDPDVIPLVGDDLPAQGPTRPAPHETATPDAVWFSSCMCALFSPSESGTAVGGVVGAFRTLAAAGGLQLRIPEGLDGLCCGTPWVSKGYTAGADVMAERVFDIMWEASEHGSVPVVCDAASCTHGLVELPHHLPADKAEKWAGVEVLDATTFVARHLDRWSFANRLGSVAVHPTCSTTHLGCTSDLVACAKAVADDVVVPVAWGCCAFAGDRGLLHPELTAAATRPEAAEINARSFDAYVSANRTCEMGMSRAVGHEYRHVLELLAEHLA